MIKRVWPLAALLLIGALALLTAPLGQAAPPASRPDGVSGQTVPPTAPGTPPRRESGPPAPLGAAPRTGPAAAFQPLVIPNFGPNVRANIDTQSPNRAQQEPSIAVNPTNVLDIVAAAKDERAGTNTKQIWIYTSTDGGTSWINQQFPLSPTSPFSSDPVVNFSDTGICYVTALPYGGGAGDGIQVARSTDGGITFGNGVHLPGTSNGSDKEWTWIDNFPSSPYYHRIYVTWMDFSTGSLVRSNYSTDQGQTWSAALTIGNANQFPQPVVFPNGDVVMTYLPNGAQVGLRRSTNGGVSFGAVQTISTFTDPPCPPDNAGCGIWRLSPLPATGVNPVNGASIVTWADGRTGKALIYYSRSTDSGATWSAAAQLAPPGVTNTYQVEPWVASDEIGTWHAVWYDDRENPNTSIFNIYYSQSTDDGATWSTAQRISTATSDLRIGIPSSYAQAAGDYINVSAAQGNVYAVWTDTRQGSGEDVYVVRGTYNQGTPTPTVTGTPPTATPTRTATATSTVTTPPTLPATVTNSPTATWTVQPGSTTTPTGTTVVASPTGTATAATTATVCPIQFTDVLPADPFYTYIRCLVCRGILSGYTTSPPCATGQTPCFNGGADVTRGQVAKIVINAAGYTDAIPSTQQTFTDVPYTNPFWVYVERAALHNVISGYSASPPCTTGVPCFLPFNSVTRGQMAKIDAQAVGYSDPIPSTQQTFTDVPYGSPFWIYVERASLHGVISGYSTSPPCPGGTPCFLPANNLTRNQAAKIVAVTFYPNCQTPARR